MIERTVVASKIKEFEIQDFVGKNLRRVGHSHTTLQRTPLGEKVVVHASRPGLVVGRQGESIKRLTKRLKDDFGLENPQVEVEEIKDIYLNPHIVAEMIADSMERFGSKRFKATMHRSLENVMAAGALGAEILLSGKLPSRRARSWRVYSGHLNKSGDAQLVCVRKAYTTAELKSGTIGVQVRIMPPDVILPDKVIFRSEVKKTAPETPEGDAAAEIQEIEKAEEVAKEEAAGEKEAAEKKPAEKKATAEKKAPATEPAEKQEAEAAESKSPESTTEKEESGGGSSG